MISLRHARLGLVVTSLVASLSLGCGSVPPPRELQDARAAYEKAQAGKAAQLTPADLHDAKVALDNAEQAFGNDPKADRTKDLAYVAERKAELAESRAGTLAATQDKDKAERDRSELTGKELARTKEQLQATGQQLQATGAQLAATNQQLVAEKAAREAAEKRARDAMDKLAVAAALAVKEESRGTVITLPGNVLFTTGQATLLPAAQEKLNQVADALKNQEDHKIVVEGHTDSQGSEASNMDLSQRRAQSVRDYIVSRGVTSDKVSAVGIGQNRPVADNRTVEGRAQNRRVEIIVQPIEKR
jgi:outer membrane protein OmpA-like peptidoglycan-associated protein